MWYNPCWRVGHESVVKLVFFSYWWMHIGSTKMRILSIFAKSKSIKINSKSTHLPVLRTAGGGVANNLNDTSHLPHLAECFLSLFCTSCELTGGQHAAITLLQRRYGGYYPCPQASAICSGWRIMVKSKLRQSRSINHHQTIYFGTIRTRQPFLLKSPSLTSHFLFLSLVVWDLSGEARAHFHSTTRIVGSTSENHLNIQFAPPHLPPSFLIL